MKGEVYTLGEIIKLKRLKIGLLQSDVAVKLGIDAPLLSKIEKGLRQLKREQIPTIAHILKADVDELLTLWLSDQIYAVVKDEKLANVAIQVTEEKIKFKKSKKK
jgi:transcriptional regulator with XRE-family HTH domain